MREALRLLDDPEQTLPEVQTDTYPWEQSEPVPGEAKAVCLVTVADYATGEGLMVRFAAVWARSEDEVRRHLARIWSRSLAHLAIVARGAEATVPYAQLCLSPKLRGILQRIEAGEGRPAVFSYEARYHMNMS